MSTSPHIDQLREHLMSTLADLRDRERPMEPDRARAVAQVASVLVDTAKVEVDYLKVTGQEQSRFLEIPADEPVESRCANCGKASSDASEMLSDYPEDGEWFCSTECRDQHNELDCPHLTHNGYRHPVESAKLIECERIMRELASWLGCGGYNADEFIPSEFEAKIRHGIEHLHPPAAPVQEPVAWQPIETAPKGSVAILVWCSKRMNIYAAYPYKSDWCAFGGGVLSETPTHWMPMPAAPVREGAHSITENGGAA